MDEYEDITHELDALMVRSTPPPVPCNAQFYAQMALQHALVHMHEGRMAMWGDPLLSIPCTTVHDEPDVRALLRSPEAEDAAQLLRLGGALVVLAGTALWVLIR